MGIVLDLKNPNVNGIIRGGRSPTRLKGELDELERMRCLRMTPLRNEHRYSITAKGCKLLGKYEIGFAGEQLRKAVIHLNAMTGGTFAVERLAGSIVGLVMKGQRVQHDPPGTWNWEPYTKELDKKMEELERDKVLVIFRGVD